MSRQNDIALLTRAAVRIGLHVESYEGRYMYDRECVGIRSTEKWGEAALAIISGSVRDERQDDVQRLVDLLRYSTVDSMGLGSIMYWPHLDTTAEAAE